MSRRQWYYKPTGATDWIVLYPITSEADDAKPKVTMSGTFLGNPVATVNANAGKEFTLTITLIKNIHADKITQLQSCKQYGTLSIGTDDPDNGNNEKYTVAATSWKHTEEGLAYGGSRHTFNIVFDTIDDTAWLQG